MACEPQSATVGCVGDDAFNMRKEDGGGPDEATNVVIEHIPGAQSATSLRCNRLALLCGPRLHLLRQGLRNHMLHAACYTLHATCYMLHATCYTLQATCFMFRMFPALLENKKWFLSRRRRSFRAPAGRMRLKKPTTANRERLEAAFKELMEFLPNDYAGSDIPPENLAHLPAGAAEEMSPQETAPVLADEVH